jgi:hypothetical protein
MSIEEIQKMVDKEVRDRIKQAEWIPVDDVENILKMNYEAFISRITQQVPPEPLLDEACWRMKAEAKIEGLLEIVETAKLGTIRNGNVRDRYEAVI